MPWKIEKRNGKHCVIKKPNTLVKCHAKPEDAKDHMAALYSSESKESSGFFTRKDADGIWNWMGIVSNNWQDTHEEWITARAHKEFAALIDSGEYGKMILDSPFSAMQIFKDIGERGTPDLWYWHLPIPIGYAEHVIYDERGYLIGIGKQHKGEFPTKVFEGLNKTDILHGMSHGMPTMFLQRKDDDERQITGYIDTEFTVMPHDKVANFGTAWASVLKEAYMQVPKEKVKYMTDVFGKEVVASFDALLGELEIFAEDSEIPRKELDMEKDQEAAGTEAVDEVVDDVDTEDAADEDEEVEGDDVVEGADESGDSEDEEEEGDVGAGMAVNDSKFQVPTDMSSFAQELTTGLKEIFVQFQANTDAKFDELKGILKTQQSEIAQLKKSDEKKLAEKAADTPVASMAGWMATQVGSVIGKEGARLNGKDERGLYNKTKEDESDPGQSTGLPPSIDKMIRNQRAQVRHLRVPAGGFGDN